ncbi:hypothetical protein DFAR_1690004 [Desulfarculales bacterium]
MDTDKQPHEVFLEVAVDRGAEYPCPECSRLCKAHDLHKFTRRHLKVSSIIATQPPGCLG